MKTNSYKVKFYKKEILPNETEKEIYLGYVVVNDVLPKDNVTLTAKAFRWANQEQSLATNVLIEKI